MNGFSFGFRKDFAELVRLGMKRQTIRQHRKDGRVPKPGDRVHLFSGLRTPRVRRLGTGKVVDCFPIYMDLLEHGQRYIVSNGVRLAPGEANEFAKLDGFPSAVRMFDWFVETYEFDVFSGFCVRWRLDAPDA